MVHSEIITEKLIYKEDFGQSENKICTETRIMTYIVLWISMAEVSSVKINWLDSPLDGHMAKKCLYVLTFLKIIR